MSLNGLLYPSTSGVDFTNILCTDFTHADPKSAKNTEDLIDCLFALLGSSGIIKADVKCW